MEYFVGDKYANRLLDQFALRPTLLLTVNGIIEMTRVRKMASSSRTALCTPLGACFDHSRRDNPARTARNRSAAYMPTSL
jgi:hypothetical protein